MQQCATDRAAALPVQRTIRAMERVGIPEDQREAIFRTVAAILHMGNIQFEQGPNDMTVAKPITVPHLAATGGASCRAARTMVLPQLWRQLWRQLWCQALDAGPNWCSTGWAG